MNQPFAFHFVIERKIFLTKLRDKKNKKLIINFLINKINIKYNEVIN
jgi:hypothetical protein